MSARICASATASGGVCGFVAFNMGAHADAAASCAQIRIQLRVPEYGWTTQKVFHLLNFLVAGLRAGVFASWDHVRITLLAADAHQLQRDTTHSFCHA